MAVRLHTSALMIGSIGYDVTRKQPYIDSVWMMARDSVSMTSGLNGSASKMIIWSVLVGSVTIWLGYYLYSVIKTEYGRVALLRHQEMIRAKLIENTKKQHDELTDEQKERLMCVICQEYLRDVILLPCHHLSACSDCYSHLASKNKCMDCSKTVDSIAHVFLE